MGRHFSPFGRLGLCEAAGGAETLQSDKDVAESPEFQLAGNGARTYRGDRTQVGGGVAGGEDPQGPSE